MKNILFLIVTILIAVLLFSCNPSKRIERKNNQALRRVEANIDLLNTAGIQWLKLNPCYPDTIREGKVITIIDSSSAKESIDSLNDFITYVLNNYNNKNIDSLKLAITKEVEKRCKPVITYKFKTDTLPPDKRAIEILQNQLVTSQLTVSNLTGKLSEKTNQINELNKSKKKTLWWSVGGGIISLLIIVSLTYLLFKK